jgi:hypothetical protein
MPHCAVTVMFSSLISISLSSRLRSRMIPPKMAVAPPCVPEPPPQGMTGILYLLAISRMAEISFTFPGWTM